MPFRNSATNPDKNGRTDWFACQVPLCLSSPKARQLEELLEGLHRYLKRTTVGIHHRSHALSHLSAQNAEIDQKGPCSASSPPNSGLSSLLQSEAIERHLPGRVGERICDEGNLIGSPLSFRCTGESRCVRVFALVLLRSRSESGVIPFSAMRTCLHVVTPLAHNSFQQPLCDAMFRVLQKAAAEEEGPRSSNLEGTTRP